jgi:hypothetical protein
MENFEPSEAPDIVESPDAATPEESTDSGGSEGGSWPKDVQAEFTKKSQSLADDRRSFEDGRQQWYSQQQQMQQQQQQHQQQQQQQYLQQQQGGAQNSQAQLLEQLRGMQYLDGPTAATLMERIVNDGINPLNQALQQRDQALAHMYKEYKTLKGEVGTQTSAKRESDLSQRFSKLRNEHSLPDEPWVNDYLQDVYYSHEGKDLDTEYPNMLRTRLDTMRKGFREMDRKTASDARASSFPGKGGEVSLTSGKTGGYKTPQDRADELWPMMNQGQTE